MFVVDVNKNPSKALILALDIYNSTDIKISSFQKQCLCNLIAFIKFTLLQASMSSASTKSKD